MSISSLAIGNSRKRLLNVTPNAFPISRVTAAREVGDDTVVDFIQVPFRSKTHPPLCDHADGICPCQDPEPSPAASNPSFLLRLDFDDELEFKFSFVIRQSDSSNNPTDTVIQGLTFAFASTSRELDNLVTREFHADPNFHKNPNVQLVGDYSTGGSSSVQLDWTWKWRPPKAIEDKGGGWRTTCSVWSTSIRSTCAHGILNTFLVSGIRSTCASPGPFGNLCALGPK